jgi:hypothetical protein
MRPFRSESPLARGQTSLGAAEGLVTPREANQTLRNELVARRKTNRVRRRWAPEPQSGEAFGTTNVRLYLIPRETF